MRILKEPEVRKAEIIDAAEKFFAAKGYDSATVNDIIKETKTSKGLFYYYFKSKEAVLDAIVEKRINDSVERSEKIAASDIPAMQKIRDLVIAQKPQNIVEETFNNIAYENNSRIHTKVLNKFILRLTPFFSQAVEEGIKAGVFSTPYPAESIQIFMIVATIIFESNFYFQWTEEEAKVKSVAYVMALERTLGAEPGSLHELTKVFGHRMFMKRV